MKKYVRIEVYLHAFLMPALEGCDMGKLQASAILPRRRDPEPIE